MALNHFHMVKLILLNLVILILLNLYHYFKYLPLMIVLISYISFILPSLTKNLLKYKLITSYKPYYVSIISYPSLFNGSGSIFQFLKIFYNFNKSNI